MDNNEEKIIIPHGQADNSSSDETPEVTAVFSDAQYTEAQPDTATESVNVAEQATEQSADQNGSTMQSATFPEDVEPVDIFATQEEKTAEASAPAKSDTRMSNNPFSSRNRYQANTNNNTTDVPQFFNDAIIANTPVEQPKSSKKGLFIGLGIGVVVIILVTVLAIFLPKMGNKLVTTQNGKQLNANSKTLFYQYANKLLYNTDSTNALSENFDSNKKYYYMDKVVIDSDYDDSAAYDTQYLNGLSELYDKFYKKFNEDNKDIDNTLAKNTMTDYSELLEFFRSDPRSVVYSNEVILDSYLSGGLTAAKNKAKTLIKNDSTNSYLVTIYNIKKDSIDTSIKVIEQYEKNGCAKDGKLVMKCANKIQVEMKGDKFITQIAKNLDGEAISLADNNYYQLSARCWEIAKMLEGK